MKKQLMILIVFLLGASLCHAGTLVEMKTNMGSVKLELFEERAPITVKNFLDYVDRGFYDQTIFHRVIRGFMIQGGGFDLLPKRKETAAPIKNEATNGLSNIRGSIAMARTGVVDSATSQFFINLVDNKPLDYRGNAPSAYGYAVFGQVIDGMDIVDRIAGVRTVNKSQLFQDYPEPQVVIESIRRID